MDGINYIIIIIIIIQINEDIECWVHLNNPQEFKLIILLLFYLSNKISD